MKSQQLRVAAISLIIAITLILGRFSSAGINSQESKGRSVKSENPAISENAVDDLIKDQSENQSMRWFYSNPASSLRGCALVIHGLNLRPEKMQPIISQLTAAGIDVLRLSLRGHGKNYTLSGDFDEEQARMEAFRNVSYPMWMNEAHLAYQQLKKRGAEKGVPLYLAAFSLGGLIGLDLLASNSDVQFDRLILFAPAIRLRAKVYL